MAAPAKISDLPPGVQGAIREGDRVLVTRDGVTLAAIVPLADLEALEAMEDEADARAAEAAIAEWRAQGSPTISLEQVVRELDK